MAARRQQRGLPSLGFPGSGRPPGP
jgi:hypothetical protein